MRTTTRLWKPAFLFAFWLTLLTGILYPLGVLGIAQLFFPFQAEGSLVRSGGEAVGSLLIGQPFDDPGYFWGRPSVTSPTPYNASSSSGSNLGPTNPALLEALRKRAEDLRKSDPRNQEAIPLDLVTASASGLDPHISPEAAFFQAPRVARERGVDPRLVEALVQDHIEKRLWGFLGEPRVNVLLLNLAVDSFATNAGSAPPRVKIKTPPREVIP